MRVLTYNVHGCIGSDRATRPDRIIQVIEHVDADVVALQEVHDEDDVDRSFLRALRRLPYEQLAYGPTMRKANGHYGNVLLLRDPAEWCERIDLSVPGCEPRGALVVRLDDEHAGRVEIVATHLGLRAWERRSQTRRLITRVDQLAADDPPALRIGVGDFNEWWPWSAVLRALRDAFGVSPPRRSFPARLPVFCLDRIFVRPKGAIESIAAVRTPLTKHASDHLPVVAKIRMPREW